MELSTKLKREKELKKRKTEYDVKLFNAVEYNFSFNGQWCMVVILLQLIW